MPIRARDMDAWLGWTGMLALVGAIVGFLGAAAMWEYFYSIGSRVLSDEEYLEHAHQVWRWGALAGTCSGFALGLLPRSWSIKALAILHLLAWITGAIWGNADGWKSGVDGYLIVHGIAIVGCGLYALGLLARVAYCSWKRCLGR